MFFSENMSVGATWEYLDEKGIFRAGALSVHMRACQWLSRSYLGFGFIRHTLVHGPFSRARRESVLRFVGPGELANLAFTARRPEEHKCAELPHERRVIRWSRGLACL